jgi:hypothetical protein
MPVALVHLFAACTQPAETPLPAPPAAPEVPAPAPAEPTDDPEAQRDLANSLGQILDGRTDAAGFAAITAPTVEFTFERQCGESSSRKLTNVLEGDAKLTLAWGMLSAGLECAPGEARCAEVPVRIDADRLACEGACCEVQNIGHNALWVRNFCTADGKVTSIRVEDGC